MVEEKFEILSSGLSSQSSNNPVMMEDGRGIIEEQNNQYLFYCIKYSNYKTSSKYLNKTDKITTKA